MTDAAGCNNTRLGGLRGIVTVLNTPFTETGEEIDYRALVRHIDYALAAGVSGFLAPAMAGEATCLTSAERLELTRVMVEAVQGRAMVIGCATSDAPGESVILAERLTQLGCDGVLIAIPFSDEKQLFVRMGEIARTTPGFIMLQDWDPVGHGIPVPVIKRLFDAMPLFKCVKIEVAEAGPKYSEVLAATGGLLHVSGGWAVTQMMEGLDRGVHAFMPTAMHHTYVAICRQYSAGNREDARKLFYRLLPVLTFANQSLDTSIHFFKRLLYRQGIYTNPAVRAPERPLDNYQSAIADELVMYAVELEYELRWR